MADPAPPAAPTSATPPPARAANARRIRLFAGLGAVILIAALAYGVYWLVVARNYVSTDDAYVNADTADITPQVAGTVARVLVADTQPVKQGQILGQIDP